MYDFSWLVDLTFAFDRIDVFFVIDVDDKININNCFMKYKYEI